jgi:hypothetical protein
VAADLLALVGLPARLVQLLRLGGSPLHQPHRGEDVEGELEVLRLPVLEHGLAELGRDQEAPERDLLAAVAQLVVVELVPSGDRLKRERK